jgi:hypothetical protein
LHQIFILVDFKKANDSIRREVLYNIPIGYGIPMKLLRLIKMCLSETYSRVRVGKKSDMIAASYDLKEEMLYRHCFSTLL